MAVELNLPADSDQKEEGRVELQETVEPDQEVNTIFWHRLKQ